MRGIIAALVSLVLLPSGSSALPRVVANDTCAGAEEVRDGEVRSGDNIGALDDYRSRERLGSNAPDLVYRFTLDEPSRVEIDPSDTEYFVDVYLRTDCEDVASEVAAASWLGGIGNQPFPTVAPNEPDPSMVANLAAGTYYMIFDGEGGAGVPYRLGAFSFSFDVSSFRPGDRCEVPLPIASGQTLQGHTLGLADDLRSPSGSSSGPDAAYAFSLNQPTVVHADTIGSTYDTVLYVRRGCATELAFNDDTGDVWQSSVDVDLPAGDYMLIVDGFDRSSRGSYTVRLG